MSLGLFLILLTQCLGLKTLVLIDSESQIEKTHSIFLKSLSDRGHSLTIKDAYEEGNKLDEYGEWKYDNLVLLAPKSEDFGDITVESIVKFIDAGHNVLVAGSSAVTEPHRELANEVGVDFDEEETVVIDHTNYDISDNTHTLIASDAINVPHLPKPKAPVLFRGIGHVARKSPLVINVLTGTKSTYSNFVGKSVAEEPQSAGNATLLVTAVQTRNNARVAISGSIDLFSDEFFKSPVQLPNSKFAKSGNEEFVAGLSKWVFQERGQLRISSFTHNKVGSDEINPRAYRIKDEIDVSLTIEEYDGATKKWVPFKKNDVQLEFVMIDPYIRLNLQTDGKGKYFSRFVLPDVYGVFKFVISYHRVGYTNLELSQQVSVHPFRHNDYERFIGAAYPYYLSAASMMGGFFLFGILFLYTQDGQDHKKKTQ